MIRELLIGPYTPFLNYWQLIGSEGRTVIAFGYISNSVLIGLHRDVPGENQSVTKQQKGTRVEKTHVRGK